MNQALPARALFGNGPVLYKLTMRPPFGVHQIHGDFRWHLNALA